MNLATRYVAMWNEPDATTRTTMIRSLWAADGVQTLVDPPQEIRDAAVRLAFPIPALEVRGHAALDARVTRAYEMFVEPGEYTFELSGDPVTLSPRVVAISWSMVSTKTGEAAGGGLDVLTLTEDGLIASDHQHI
ncbi:MAG: hypothetical protein HOY71_50385 [Nonomuraea sp.]|nr:hypothetical protein [Nonomuraea sp.]